MTLISLLMPSSVTNAESVMVEAPRQHIVAAISDLNNWKNWQPVFRSDSSIQIIDARHATWGHNKEKNQMEVVSVDSNMVQVNLTRLGQPPVTNYFALSTVPGMPGVQVEWRAITPLRWFPWEKFSGMMVGKISSQAYQQSLQSLKTYLEQ